MIEKLRFEIILVDIMQSGDLICFVHGAIISVQLFATTFNYPEKSCLQLPKTHVLIRKIAILEWRRFLA